MGLEYIWQQSINAFSLLAACAFASNSTRKRYVEYVRCRLCPREEKSGRLPAEQFQTRRIVLSYITGYRATS
jgi:hypothetical protein